MTAAEAGPISRADGVSRARDQLRAAPPPGAAREPDPRTVPWHTLRRLALLGGEFAPPARPVSAGEITALLLRVGERGGPGLGQPAQRRQLARLLSRYGLAGGAWPGGDRPRESPRLRWLAGGRAALHEMGPGGLVAGESDLAGRGLLARVEPALDVWCGRWWLGATVRLHGPLHVSGRPLAPLGPGGAAGGWPAATGLPATGAARRNEAWHVGLPRLATGVHLGRWALTAGVFPASVGPGLDGGGLTLTETGASVPQFVFRRTAPLRWSGFLRPLAPDHLLLRAGVASEQTISYQDPWGRQERPARPAFMQWLLTWNHTAWWRTTVTHAVLAAPRRGASLWPDLLQANFPLLDATWNELDRGPVTDRLVSLTLEVRFREAPWPLLPADAGRVYWEYGGEDFRPHDALPVVPEISAPASLAGVELYGRRGDLAVEYLDTRHPSVLWYSNAGFTAGYAHRGTLLGHPLGGGCRAWTALARWRTADGIGEWELRIQHAAWQTPRGGSRRADRQTVSLGWRRLTGRGSWSAAAGRVREEVDGRVQRWWQGHLERRF